MTSLVLRDWLTSNSDPLEPFRILAETLPQLVWTARPDGELEFVNRRWIEYTGLDSDHAQSGAWKKLIHPDDYSDSSSHWEHSLKHFTPLETQNRFLGGSGEYRWFLIRAEPLLDSNGQPVIWFGTCTDIHNERSEQHRLRDRCQTIVENANDGVLEVSLDGTIQFANRRMAELLGCPVDELIGRSALDFLFEEEQRRARIRLKDRGEGHGERYEARWRRADGSEIWMHTASTPNYNSDGIIIGSFGIFTDIDAIKLAERIARQHQAALTLSEGRFRAAVDAVGGLLWTNSSDGVMQGEQPGWAAFTGQTYDEYQGYGWAKAVHPDDVQPSIESWKKAVAHRSTYIFEHRLLRHDGVYRFFAIRAVPVFNEDGTIREWVGVHVDITEQRDAEQALRVSEEKFRLITDTMPQIVWSTRPDGYHDYFNKRWYEYTGMPLPHEPGGEYDPHESGQGWNWKEYLHPDDYEPSAQRWQEALRTGELYAIEYRFRRTDGVYRWFIGRALPLKDEHGQITRWFGTCTDVEDVKAAEKALRDADRRKDNFLATLAHELRNPLAPIRSATELLKLTSIDDPVIDEIRDAIDRQVTHMVRLIDDLLDISRITNGKLQLRHEPVILQQVLQSAIETSMPLITAGQHQLNIQTVKEPIPLVGDPVRLAQIFSNLLTNAAKYSEPNGAICVIVNCLDHEVCVIVRDHGIGIPPEHLPRLFEMFSQVQSAVDRSQGGLGIGLSLVRALVEHHDGTVEAHSQGLGTGSEFTVRLPIRQHEVPVPTTVSAPAQPIPKQTAPTSRRILVVDDSPTIARMLSMLLTTKGHVVETASNGEEALSALQSGAYDLVLMDIGMPIMNGYEAAKRARAAGISIPMVALTGFGREEDKLAATQAGFNTHLIKPISSQALDQVLGQLP
ncbi:hybrid sensor histidine kinase/response regulator [Lacunimicrobium album]